jgi:hypothetical protein
VSEPAPETTPEATPSEPAPVATPPKVKWGSGGRPTDQAPQPTTNDAPPAHK